VEFRVDRAAPAEVATVPLAEDLLPCYDPVTISEIGCVGPIKIAKEPGE
jgi:hypothetical protein